MRKLSQKIKSYLIPGGFFILIISLVFSIIYPSFGQAQNSIVSEPNIDREPTESTIYYQEAPLEMMLEPSNFPQNIEGIERGPETNSSFLVPQIPAPTDWVLQNRQSPQEGWENSLTYDPVNNRAIFFGGVYCENGLCYYGNDSWALNLDQGNEVWEKLNVLKSPDYRSSHTAVYDSERQRIVLFGGEQSWNDYLRDTWVMNLDPRGQENWQELIPTGINPPQLSDHVAVYDSNRDRMIVFSGAKETFTGPVLQNNREILVLNFENSPQGEWETLYPEGPFPQARDGATAIFDPENDRMILFGGYGGGTELNDIWILDFTNSETGQWFSLNLAGDTPEPRWNPSATYDPIHKLFILFGGVNFSNGQSYNDLYILNLRSSNPRWIKINPQGEAPNERGHFELIYDQLNARPIIYSGAWNQYGFIMDSYTDINVVNYDQGQITWERIKVLGEQPREYHGSMATIYDSERNRLIIHGGDRSTMFPSIVEDQVYILDLNASKPKWKFSHNSGTSRMDHQAVYDSLNDRMVFFGGQDGTTNDLNKVHILNLSSEDNEWQTLDLPNPPMDNRLVFFTAIYDEVGQRMIVYGGAATPDLTERNQVWALDLTLGQENWYQIFPEGENPPARYSHSAIYDSQNNQMVIYGGHDGIVLNDAWALDLTLGQESWTELETTGDFPSPHYSHKALYDSNRHQMVIFGGLTDDREVHALDLETLIWSMLDPQNENPAAQNKHSYIYDPVRDRGILLSGNLEGNRSDDTYLLNDLDF